MRQTGKKTKRVENPTAASSTEMRKSNNSKNTITIAIMRRKEKHNWNKLEKIKTRHRNLQA